MTGRLHEVFYGFRVTVEGGGDDEVGKGQGRLRTHYVYMPCRDLGVRILDTRETCKEGSNLCICAICLGFQTIASADARGG